MTKLKKKKILLLMKYQHVADVVEFYSCTTCAKGVKGVLNSSSIHQYSGNVCRKIALLKSFNFATSKEPNSHKFLATGQILVSKEADFVMYKVREFFFQFSNSDKNFTV